MKMRIVVMILFFMFFNIKNVFCEGVNFEFGSYKLTPDSSATLDVVGKKILEKMKDNPSMKIKIIGHTDNIGKYEANIKLSKKRAESVRNYLIKKFKIPEERFIIDGFGPLKPVTDNKTAEGRALNRRVEVEFAGEVIVLRAAEPTSKPTSIQTPEPTPMPTAMPEKKGRIGFTAEIGFGIPWGGDIQNVNFGQAGKIGILYAFSSGFVLHTGAEIYRFFKEFEILGDIGKYEIGINYEYMIPNSFIVPYLGVAGFMSDVSWRTYKTGISGLGGVKFFIWNNFAPIISFDYVIINGAGNSFNINLGIEAFVYR